LESPLPVPSLLPQVRTRLGVDRFTRVFNEILRQGREQRLVKDRPRLKDVTHLIANIALPSTLRLVAQTREQVLKAAEGFAARAVAAHRAQVATVRAATADLQEEQRLLARVAHLGELVAWGEQWQRRLRQAAAPHQPLVSDEQEAAFGAALELAHKVLNDREPEATDKLLSLADRDARTGKPGDYYDGYLLETVFTYLFALTGRSTGRACSSWSSPTA